MYNKIKAIPRKDCACIAQYDGKNDYVHIKSIVMLSTDDMVNWEYHGFIDIARRHADSAALPV